MNKIFENISLDIVNYDKHDEQFSNNNKRDNFMKWCFKIFIVVLISSILFFLCSKCFRNVEVK